MYLDEMDENIFEHNFYFKPTFILIIHKFIYLMYLISFITSSKEFENITSIVSIFCIFYIIKTNIYINNCIILKNYIKGVNNGYNNLNFL